MKTSIQLFLFFLLTHGLLAQKTKKEIEKPESNLEIRSGKLKNGLSYYIKPIPEDNGKVQAKLIIKAGSLQENDGQENLAHLLEHMAFNGTENFPDLRNDTDFYTQLNIQPQDLRASVGGDRTVYSFNYPQHLPTALDTALAIFHDIASGKVLLKEDAVEGERKAIYQEGIAGGDPGMIYPYAKIDYLLTGCNYISAPNEREAAIMNTSIKELKGFYNDWYRPDLMALTIVGNIKNIDQVEQNIKSNFKGLEARGKSRKKKNCDQNYLSQPKQFLIEENTAITTKTFIPQTVMQFYFRLPGIFFDDFKDEENLLIWDLLSKIVAKRLKNERLTYNANYTTTFYSDDLPAVKLVVKLSNELDKTVGKVFSILSGISSYGIRKDEWEEVVNERINYLENVDYHSSGYWSEELENSIVEEKPLPDMGDNKEITFLQSLELEYINGLLINTSWKPDDIAVILPKGVDQSQFTRSLIEKHISKGLNHPKIYDPIKAPDQLMSSSDIAKLNLAKIVSRDFGDYNEDKIELENGIRIILKDLKPDRGRYKDKLMIQGFSPVGANCFGVGDTEAMLAPFIIANAGVGNYNKFEIDKLLSQTSFPFGIRRYINPNETGVKVELSPRDMELALQLIFLSFTNPRFDEAAFDDWKLEEERNSRRNINAKNDFMDFINQQNGEVKIPRGGDRYKQSLNVNYENAFKKYKALHENASDFTFVITGDFTKKKVLPLVQKYLGNLPNNKSSENCMELAPINSDPSNTDRKKTYFKIPYNVSNNLLSIRYKTALKSLDFREVVGIEFLGRALDLKLKSLRYEKNFGIYSSAGYSYLNYDNKSGSINITLESNKEDFEKVLQTCNTYFEELKSEPVSNTFLQVVKETSYLPKWLERFQGTNNAMQLRLYDHYRFGIAFSDPKEVQAYIDQFTVSDLQEVAKEILNENKKFTYTGSFEKILKF